MNRPTINGRQMSYSEILRVIGRYMDTHNLGEGRLLETAEGFILQGVVQIGPTAGERQTYQLTGEDITDLLANATAQRGKLM